MEQTISLSDHSLLDIPDGTKKISMRIQTTQAYSEALMRHFNLYFLNRLGGHEDSLRKTYVLCLSVKFEVGDPCSRVEFSGLGDIKKNFVIT